MRWGFGKHEFSAHMGIIHSIPCRNFFFNLKIPSPVHEGWVGKHKFCVQMWAFCSIPSKDFFVNLPSP